MREVRLLTQQRLAPAHQLHKPHQLALLALTRRLEYRRVELVRRPYALTRVE